MNLLTDNLACLFDPTDTTTVTAPDTTITSVQDGANPSNQFVPAPVITASGPYWPGNLGGLSASAPSAADQQALMLTQTLSIPPSSPSTHYAVYKPFSVTSPACILGGPSGGPIDAGLGGNTVVEVGDGASYLDYAFAMTPGQTYTFCVSSDGTVAGTVFYVDGIAQTPVGTAGTTLDLSLKYIGTRSIGFGSFCDGLIGQSRSYTVQHSLSDVQQITRYLERKFGV